MAGGAAPLRRARATASGRPAADPACAGCPQLVTLRALRRAGVEVTGGLGCEAAGAATFTEGHGRRAAMAGLGRLRREGAEGLLSAAGRAGARLLVVADRSAPARPADADVALAAAGARVVLLDLADAAGAEARVREALDAPGTALVAVAPCVRGAARGSPLVVDAVRCNRCGACLSLACPALSDGGGESVEIDPATCTGCGRCAPLCRSRALRPVPG